MIGSTLLVFCCITTICLKCFCKQNKRPHHEVIIQEIDQVDKEDKMFSSRRVPEIKVDEVEKIDRRHDDQGVIGPYGSSSNRH